MLFRKILPVILLFCSAQLSAQRIVIRGQETSRPLIWDDFSGRPDREASYHAYTYWNISYKFDAFQFKGDTAKWNVIITVELGKNSWKKNDKITDTLLKHEQGHFDIGILCAMELQRRINATVFMRTDYQASFAAIIKEVVDKYKQMDLQYDAETNHHANRQEQWKWDAFFAANIKRSS